jgi:nucleotide-binding universal stress UspA family protein
MSKIQRILCPTDLSSESDEALRYAVALTQAYKAELLLLHCTDIKSEGQMESRNPSLDIACSFDRALVNHLGTAELSSLEWDALAIDNVNNVGTAIAHQAAKYHVDLIIMRSRRRPHAAALLGSTAETVSRTAPCPVLITHPAEREWVSCSTGEIDLHRVLVAHDFSRDAELALNYGVSLAEEYQAELHLLHIISHEEREDPEVTWSHVGLESLYHEAARRLNEAVPREAPLWCKVITTVGCGKPFEEVLAYARKHQIDLICMGASGAGFSLKTILGSTVDRVLRQAPCPLFVARPVAASVVTAPAENELALAASIN